MSNGLYKLEEIDRLNRHGVAIAMFDIASGDLINKYWIQTTNKTLKFKQIHAHAAYKQVLPCDAEKKKETAILRERER